MASIHQQVGQCALKLQVAVADARHADENLQPLFGISQQAKRQEDEKKTHAEGTNKFRQRSNNNR